VKSIRHYVLAASVIAIGAAAACDDDDPDAPASAGAAGRAGGPAGGSAGTSGAAGAAGTAGAAGSAGAAGAGGTAGAGGGTAGAGGGTAGAGGKAGAGGGAPLEPACVGFCERVEAANCPSDPAADTCVATCDQSIRNMPAECVEAERASVRCIAQAPSPFQCDPEDETSEPKPGVCEAEVKAANDCTEPKLQAAVDACGAWCAASADANCAGFDEATCLFACATDVSNHLACYQTAAAYFNCLASQPVATLNCQGPTPTPPPGACAAEKTAYEACKASL
jgi:hypothetical protein